jgi:hypothetical protein
MIIQLSYPSPLEIEITSDNTMSENASSMSGNGMTENEGSENESRSDDETGSDDEILPEAELEFDREYCSGCGRWGGFLTPSFLQMIEEAAERGCRTCRFLQSVLERYFPENDEGNELAVCCLRGVYELIIRPRSPDPAYISIHGHHSNPSSLSLSFNPYAESGPTSALPDIIGDTSCAEALALAKEWISDCDESHADCRQETTGLLPTLVLDLGNADAEDNICLYTTSNEPAKYICLSHCWGID